MCAMNMREWLRVIAPRQIWCALLLLSYRCKAAVHGDEDMGKSALRCDAALATMRDNGDRPCRDRRSSGLN
jgi:hypothetical protein